MKGPLPGCVPRSHPAEDSVHDLVGAKRGWRSRSSHKKQGHCKPVHTRLFVTLFVTLCVTLFVTPLAKLLATHGGSFVGIQPVTGLGPAAFARSPWRPGQALRG